MSFYGKPTRANQALYDITKDLCSGGVLVNRGTPYPCTQEDLDSYRHFPRGLYSFDPIGADEAVWRLLDSLDPFREPSRTVQSALRRLYAGINMRHKAPDIVIKAFRDLDIVFFGGNLSGSCRVFWKGERGVRVHVDVDTTLGYTSQDSPGRATISLNSELILRFRPRNEVGDPFEDIWSTLLHEMTHAYGMICCGDFPGDGHGWHFRMCLNAVHARAQEFLGIHAISREEMIAGDYAV